MRKLILITVAFAMTFTMLYGCTAAPEQAVSAETAAPEQVPEATPVQEETPAPAADHSAGLGMVGEWVDYSNARVSMTVEDLSDRYGVIVRWSNSAFEYIEWIMSGAFEQVEDGRIAFTDCIKIVVTYNEDGTSSQKIEYSAGEGHITYVNDMLYWHDAQEDMGEELMFVRWVEEPEVPFAENMEDDEKKPAQSHKTEEQPKVIKCGVCGNYYEEGDAFKNHVCKPGQKPADGKPNTNGKNMVGYWADSRNSRVSMEVRSVYGGFDVTVSWADSAYQAYEWRMTGSFEDVEDGRIVSNDCAHMLVTYNDDGSVSRQLLYDDGRAHITYVNGMLYWFDDQEGMGDELMFERASKKTAPEKEKTEPAKEEGSSAAGKGQDMVGRWADYSNSRVSMNVESEGDKFYVTISWTDSAAQSYEWRMSGGYEDVEDGRIVSDDCKCVLVTYNNGGIESEEILYSHGKAHITYVNGMLYWFDYQEDKGGDLLFERA